MFLSVISPMAGKFGAKCPHMFMIYVINFFLTVHIFLIFTFWVHLLWCVCLLKCVSLWVCVYNVEAPLLKMFHQMAHSCCSTFPLSMLDHTLYVYRHSHKPFWGLHSVSTLTTFYSLWYKNPASVVPCYCGVLNNFEPLNVWQWQKATW